MAYIYKNEPTVRLISFNRQVTTSDTFKAKYKPTGMQFSGILGQGPQKLVISVCTIAILHYSVWFEL